MKRRLIAMVLLSMLFGKTCLADNTTQVSRYLTVSNKPQFSQTNLLTQSVQVRFTQNIQTVGDAMNYLLRFSGYSLIPENQMNLALQIILSKPLPIIDRELGPVTLSDGLITLAGPAFNLTQDPVNRVVDFQLKPAYQRFIKNKHIIGGNQ
jgi:conjugative transfer region protein (TIGR03748 family)